MVQPLFGLLQCHQPGGLPLDLLFSNSISDQVGYLFILSGKKCLLKPKDPR